MGPQTKPNNIFSSPTHDKNNEKPIYILITIYILRTKEFADKINVTLRDH